MNDSYAQRGKEWLEELIGLLGLKTSVTADTQRSQPPDKSCWLDISTDALTPEQVQTLIGEQGKSLDAMQYLINATLNLGQSEDAQTAYTIELDGYRARRQAELEDMAEKAIQHVRETNQEYEMPPLSSAERRQLHTLFQAHEDLESESRGREPDRRLVVRRSHA